MLSIWSCPKFGCLVKGYTNEQSLVDLPRIMSVSSFANLRTGRWFHPWLGQYSFQELMIVTETGFIPLSPVSVFSTMVMWESSQWLGQNIVWSTGQKNSRKAWIGALATAI